MEKRTVCSSIFVNFLFMLLLFNDVGSQEDHHGHDHGHDHGHETVVIEPEGPSPFFLAKSFLIEKELKGIQNGQAEEFTIDADQLTEITVLLLGRFNCSERLDETCRECAEVIAARIYVLLEESEENGIDEDGFDKASVVLLHTLSARNLQHYCQTDSNLDSIQLYAKALLATGGTSDVMTKADLQTLLISMRSDYRPSSYSRCFDVDSIFSSVLYRPESGAKTDDVFKIASQLIVKFLEGQCIGHAQEVGPATFLEAVMQTFSMDDDYLSEIELDELLLQLSIGGDHSTHDHGDHDHGAHDHGDHDHAHDEHGHAHVEEDHAQHEHDHSDHDHHMHRRDLVRSLAHRLQKRAMSGVGDDGHDHAHGGHAHEDHAHGDNHATETVPSNSKDVVTSLLDKQCYTAHQLFDIHGFNHSVGISRSEFPQICPSLIQQILSRACQFTVDHVDDGIAVATPEVWLYGMVSVLIISGCSIFSGLFLPCMSQNFYHNAVNTLVALAVAAMSGDALIHLLPMALGLHVHDHSGGHDHHHDHDHGPFSTEFVYVWKCTVAMGTVYVFFLFEMLVGFVTGHTHSHGVDRSGKCDQQDQDLEKMGSPKSPSSQNNDNPDVRRNGHPPTDDVTKQNGAYDSGLSDDQIMAEERPSTPQFVAGEKRHVFEETKDIEQGKAQRRWICFSKGPLPVMVIIGDGLHNFGDGLAIGAAFLAGIGPGLSTSLAVFCHELPHELGDIAILLKSGISLKWALVLNFVSALTCVAGLVVGFIVGVTLEARQWIFAVTAGTFLYIALADMLPQLLRFRDSDNPKLMFCLINIGFLCGMAIIVVIALYEDAILVKL